MELHRKKFWKPDWGGCIEQFMNNNVLILLSNIFMKLKEITRKRIIWCSSFIKEQEDDPNEWFRTYSHDYYKAAAATVARFIGADETNIVFVDNATSGNVTLFWHFDFCWL